MREMDGIHIYQRINRISAEGLINFLKFTSNMDISEHRRPQVGARFFNFENNQINLRLSSMGDFSNRESLVIRLIYPLGNLHSDDNELDEIINSRGLVLFSGPTGSGKTTSMYQLAKKYGEEKIVLSIEDPVEITEASFLQVQVNERAGMSYAELVKTSLRHRPDILILGEIRDENTAKMALRASLSGHLVISTVHARNKFAVIARMMELGINQQELLSALSCVIYQRLVPHVDMKIHAYRDILNKNKLENAIKIPQSNYSDWQNLMNDAYQKGLISHQTYQQYQQG